MPEVSKAIGNTLLKWQGKLQDTIKPSQNPLTSLMGFPLSPMSRRFWGATLAYAPDPRDPVGSSDLIAPVV